MLLLVYVVCVVRYIYAMFVYLCIYLPLGLYVLIEAVKPLEGHCKMT